MFWSCSPELTAQRRGLPGCQARPAYLAYQQDEDPWIDALLSLSLRCHWELIPQGRMNDIGRRPTNKLRPTPMVVG